jgi:hypothetical protein
LNSYRYTYEQGVHCFRFVEEGKTTFAAFMAHVEQVVSSASKRLCILADVQHKGEEVSVLEVLVTIRAMEKRIPDRLPVRVAVVERDEMLLQTIRVVCALISRSGDQFRVFLHRDADAAMSWLLEA